jgi:predicted phage-related endonuclease
MKHISSLDCLGVAALLDHGDAWHFTRAAGIGGSDAGIIASGDIERMERLRLVKTGAVESDNLDHVLAVQMGSWSEPLNRLWLSRALQMDVRPGRSYVSESHPFMRANTDGEAADGALVECKHTGAWSKAADLMPRYYPQIQHCLHVTGAPFAYLSVFIGSDKHVWEKIERDSDYIAGLIAAEETFWSYVTTNKPLTPEHAVDLPAAIADMREIDMTGNNLWATSAARWLEARPAAMNYEIACAELKELVPKDVRRALGYGVMAVRDGRGLSIKPVK